MQTLNQIMQRTNIIQGLTLIAIIDAEKGPIQCRSVKVTRSQRVSKSMRRTIVILSKAITAAEK